MPNPKQGNKPWQHRQIIDQETFDFTTPNFRGAARPIDPYARPGQAPTVQKDPDVALFNTSLDNLRSALGSMVDIKQDYDKEQKAAGAAAAGRKEALPKDASEAYIKGHELVSGKAAAVELEAALTEHFEQNKDEDPLRFKTSQEKIVKQFMNGRSDEFVAGIMSDAIDLEQKFGGAYHAHTVKKVKDEGLTKLAQGFQYDAKQIIDAPIPSEEKAQALREMVTGAQVIGGGTYRLSKTEVSDHLLDVVGRMAKDAGQPELMKFATIPDKDGVALASNPKLAAQVYQWTRAAQEVSETNARELEVRVKKLKDETENRVGNQIVGLLLDGNADIRPAHELLIQYSDPTKNKEGVMLSPSFVEHAHRLISTRGAGYALQSNPKVYTDLLVKANEGKLSLGELATAKGLLEESDYKGLLATHLREVDAESKGKSQLRKDYDVRLRDVKRVVGATDAFGKVLDPLGPARAAYAQDRGLAWFVQFTEENKREPNVEEQRKALKNFEEDSYKYVGGEPPVAINTSGSSAGPQAPPPAAAPGAPKPAAAKQQPSGPQSRVTSERLQSGFDKARQRRSGQ